MQTSRDLRAALTWWRGAHAYTLLAQGAYRRAALDPFTDPRVTALALGYTVVPIMSLDDRWRAEVSGRTIRSRWHPEHVEDRLNVFHGLGLALLHETGTTDPTPTQAWSMTLALALPDEIRLVWDEHPHVPRWLIDLRLAARRGDESGTRHAVGTNAKT